VKRSYSFILNMLFVYMNVMLTKTNEIRNIWNSFKPKIFEIMMKFHPKYICVIRCSATFGLAQRLFVECEGVLRVP
jgi:hypothetical protein